MNNAGMENTAKTSFLENTKVKFFTSLYFKPWCMGGELRGDKSFFLPLNLSVPTLTAFPSAASQGAVDNRNRRNAMLQGAGERMSREVYPRSVWSK